jgi:hypothetical protein
MIRTFMLMPKVSTHRLHYNDNDYDDDERAAALGRGSQRR